MTYSVSILRSLRNRSIPFLQPRHVLKQFVFISVHSWFSYGLIQTHRADAALDGAALVAWGGAP